MAPTRNAGMLQDTATYESTRLRTVIADAARFNRRVPPALGAYTARIESEISIGTQRPDKGEMSVSVEQVASDVTWNRTGAFEQRVVGYRSQAVGLQFTSLGFFRNAWAVPSLYGNRIALLFGVDTLGRSSRVGQPSTVRSTVFAVHPLADDRERIYRFRGGDTALVLRMNDREIPIIRVQVEPRLDLAEELVVFTGELDLDATRQHLVRMRGSFARVGGSLGKPGLLARSRLQTIAFVELINAEMDQLYWLPTYQRFEAQAIAPLIGDARAVFRIVSRFRDFHITAPAGDAAAVRITGPADSLQTLEHRLRFAPVDSMRVFDSWASELGTMSSTTTATDFDDVAPAVWRAAGPPVTTLRPERVDDVVHVNRVEGVWTGLGITRRFRSATPGLTIRAIAGYAWSEHTVRGRTIIEYARARMRYGIRAGRTLDITNDFRVAFDSGDATSAIFGVDDYDYIDRRSAMLSVGRLLPGRFGNAIRLDIGYASDRPVYTTMARSLIGREPFHANRPALDGRYLRSVLTLDWRPDINGEMMRAGYGGRAYYERGDGELRYERVELRGAMRWNHGRMTLAGRADVGMVSGRTIPPQQMFELGSSEALPGYGFKEFAGNHAALFRGAVMYRLHAFDAPVPLTRRLWLPSPSPALAIGIQAGWTELSTDAARTAVTRLNAVDPQHLLLVRTPARATQGVRATINAGIRLFGGAVGVLMARPVDHPGRWRLLLSLGGQL